MWQTQQASHKSVANLHVKTKPVLHTKDMKKPTSGSRGNSCIPLAGPIPACGIPMGFTTFAHGRKMTAVSFRKNKEKGCHWRFRTGPIIPPPGFDSQNGTARGRHVPRNVEGFPIMFESLVNSTGKSGVCSHTPDFHCLIPIDSMPMHK